MRDDVLKNSNTSLDNCNRCGDEKEINKFGICKSCQVEVDHEYGMLYSVKTMDY